MNRQRVLTGITTSGTPHLGNYAGAIRPAIEASLLDNVDSYYFLADYHALIKCHDPEIVAQSRLAIAATWLACGLNPEKVTFYRQSDIPEIPELSWILTCMTPKGLMNRAHAYKASVDANVEKQVEPDDGVTMGLFSYPVLMAADIIMFSANKVPVGRDQIQHIEMARDIAQRFNHQYGQGKDILVLPEVHIEDDVATLPGLDGRKMSKSYGNVIPLFEGGSKQLKAAISRIVTDSKLPGEAKNPDDSHLFTLYRAFGSAQQNADFRQALIEGMGWGDAKQAFFDLLESQVAPMREKYNEFISKPELIEEILQAGAVKARQEAMPLLQEVRHAVGLRKMVAVTTKAKADKKSAKTARFVSFRGDDGQFSFRFMATDGSELFVSNAFANPKDAGLLMKQLPEAIDSISLDANHLVFNGSIIASLTSDDNEALLDNIKNALVSLQADK